MSQLSFHYAAMSAGKTSSLLQTAYNYRAAGQLVGLYTAGLDDRDGVGVISSRIGKSQPARTFDETSEFTLASIEGAQILFFDEAQFLQPLQVQQLHRLANVHGVPVHCYGLRSDFQGNPFPGSAMLMALADRLQEYRQGVCGCGNDATMNMRVDANGNAVREGEQILIGGNNRYLPVCPQCFYDDGKRQFSQFNALKVLDDESA